MDFLVERSLTLTEAVIDRIGEAIVTGELKRGERLVETEISKRMGVSRAPLREALRVLAADGLVELRSGRGAFVASPTKQAIEEMGVFRGLIEGTAARLVAAKGSPASLKRLDALRLSVEQAQKAGNHSLFLNLHWKFHEALCEESGNQFLLKSWQGVSKLVRLYLQMSVHPPKNDTPAILRNNKAFLRALTDGPPERAEALLRSQIIRVVYQSLELPVPAAIQEYVTVYVDDDGEVKPYVHTAG